MLLLVLVPSTANATGYVTQTESQHDSPDLHEAVSLSLAIDQIQTPEVDFLSSVAMHRFPAGSLRVDYDGIHGVLVKHARNQYRRFVRRATKEGWLVRQDDDEPYRALFERVDHAPASLQSNGNWWDRTWFESFPTEKGGAPEKPHVHTYGTENSWSLGPLTVTNTLKLRFDYIAFFEVNPEPVSHDHARDNPRLSFDVRPLRGATLGTQFKFNVKPRLQVGMPDDGDWLSALRSAALQISFEIRHAKLKLFDGEVEVKWKSDDGLIVTLEIALATW